MTAFSSYILSVVGIILLTVLVHIILPEGSMSKYIQNILSLIIVFVMVSPISGLLNYNFDASSILEGSRVSIDDSFISLVNAQTVNQLEFSIERELTEFGFNGVFVVISANITNTPVAVEKIEVDLSNLVMNRDVQHINKYTKIKEVILKNLEIEEGKIVFYE